jgi:hypothetical protein
MLPPFLDDSGLSILNSERERINSGGHPAFMTQPWFPSLLNLSCDVPWNFRPIEDLLVSAQGKRNLLCEVASFRLVAWMLSGEDSKGMDF